MSSDGFNLGVTFVRSEFPAFENEVLLTLRRDVEVLLVDVLEPAADLLLGSTLPLLRVRDVNVLIVGLPHIASLMLRLLSWHRSWLNCDTGSLVDLRLKLIDLVRTAALLS